MKTKFLMKLLLLSLVCLSLNSCTADEIPTTKKTDTSKTITDGDPVLPNPK
jgi:hypothetical protein